MNKSNIMQTDIAKATIFLTEHQSQVVAIDDATARLLQENEATKVTVSPSEGGWRLTPSGVVGTFQINGQRFVIQPKIGIPNVLALMDVETNAIKWLHDSFEYEQVADLLVAIIRLFVRSLDRAIVQGLRYDYVVHEESLSSIRGRVDFKKVLRRPGILLPVPCTFEEYTPNIRINQLLLRALQLSVRIPDVPPSDHLRLKKLTTDFDEVSITQNPIDWVDTWVPSRLERHFETPVRLAALIIRNLAINHRGQGQQGTTFLIEMHALVEKFIEVRLRRFLPPGYSLHAQDKRWLDVDAKIQLRPDIVIRKDKADVAVADIKYKSVDEIQKINNADLYQVHTYASVLGLPRATIISCIAGKPPTNGNLAGQVRRTGISINLVPIDLSVPINEIDSQLRTVCLQLVYNFDEPLLSKPMTSSYL